MLRGLEPSEQRRQQQGPLEARVASAGAAPRLELRAATVGDERGRDGGPAFLVCVEQQPGPLWRGDCSGDEVGDGLGVCHGDERLLLRSQGSVGRSVQVAMEMDGQRAAGDPRRDLDLQFERCRTDLREPEAMLLDEVEGEQVRPRWPWRGDGELQLDRLPGRDRVRERCAAAVPDDGVPERVEPVVGSAHPRLRCRAPARAAGVLDRDAGRGGATGTLRLDRPTEPARGERAGRNGVLAGSRHDGGYSSRVSEPLLVRAARREEVERTPVWFMRQAGRSLPEYRAIRERYAFFDVAHTPELCAEVTLQPVRRHDVDAAVMFADIMTPVLGMGIDVRLVEGVGPVVEEPVRTLADVERLRIPDPEEAFAPVFEAVRIVRSELRPDQAVIGFCGGPFTVAGYLIEGRPSRDFVETKRLMLGKPRVWQALLARLAETFAAYVEAKARAGADVIQLFDSWVGALSPAQYRDHVAPHSARILTGLDVPTIHFGTGASTLLEELAAAGGDVIGLDWRIPLDRGWAAVPDRGVQGNLDPAVLLAPWDVVEAEVRDVLERAGRRPGHIFNLGHGVFPNVDPDVLTRLAAFVHEQTAAAP